MEVVSLELENTFVLTVILKEWRNGGMGTDLLEAVIVNQLRAVTMDESTECQPILETEEEGEEEEEVRGREVIVLTPGRFQ